MLGVDARTARSAWTVLLIALAAAVVYLTRRTILIFMVALLLAYLLAPLVDLLDRFRPARMPRVLSLVIVYLLMIVLIGAAGATVGVRIYDEAAQLGGRVPERLTAGDPLASLPLPASLEPWKAKAVDAIRKEVADNADQILPFVGHVGQGILSALGNLGFVVLIPVLTFFFLKDAGFLRRNILDQFAEGPGRSLLEDVFSDVHVLLGQYVRALVILACATLVCYYLFLRAIGLPYAALLAGLAGTLEFIPVVGPLTAGVVILLVAVLSGNLKLAAWILLFLLVYRLFQDYVLQPHLMRSGVELHALWVIFGVLAGEQIGGVAGVFLSIPVLAILRVIYVRILKARRSSALAGLH
jgi:predicted PurR-regulated permease PerM